MKISRILSEAASEVDEKYGHRIRILCWLNSRLYRWAHRNCPYCKTDWR